MEQPNFGGQLVASEEVLAVSEEEPLVFSPPREWAAARCINEEHRPADSQEAQGAAGVDLEATRGLLEA